ncbi:MAG: hypothetical protein DDT19_02265 [Syntrophomonadaceae bacterium]|nr:hypothetical protein [Bacillota bacterium]
MVVGMINDFIVIIVLLVLLLNLVLRGYIHPYFAVLTLLLLVFFRAKARSLGGGLGHLIRRSFTIGLPLLSLAILAIRYGQGDLRQTWLVLGSLTALFLSILGVYLMIWGSFSSPYGIIWNFPALLSIMVFISDLALGRYIPLSWAAIAIMLLVILRGIGNLFGGRTERTLGKTYRASLPLASLAVLILIFLGYEAGLPLTSSFGIVVILAVLFFAFYLIVLGPPSRWRR